MNETTETSVFAGLQPIPVWKHFATLCRFPRPSKAEGPLRDHLGTWATAKGLSAEVDAVGNLLVRKPAAAGCQQWPAVVLQAHLDMVCQKNSDTRHDFTRDAIQPTMVDGWLKADSTTLGADNGVGVALMLAVLEDTSLRHGPIEALFTVDEEAGMGGARGLAGGWLQGRLMLNLDTEEWGEFFSGCAGGVDVNAERVACPEPVPPGWATWEIALRGLRGGHSGVDIHEERGNAIKCLVRVLRGLEADTRLRLSSLSGGSARNALPREAIARVAMPSDGAGALRGLLEEWQRVLRRELAGIDEGLSLEARDATFAQVLARPEQAAWLASLQAAHHGVWRRSIQVPGVVETSCNLGIVEIGPAGGRCNFMVRSLLDSGTEALADEIVSLFMLSGTLAEKSGQYPGWAPNPASPLLARCQGIFHREFGQDSQVQVIHAGLECGLIAAKYPGMDIVSFGPTIRGAHAPGEAVEVASVERVWRLLVAILADLS